jgi:hypothetical protein
VVGHEQGVVEGPLGIQRRLRPLHLDQPPRGGDRAVTTRLRKPDFCQERTVTAEPRELLFPASRRCPALAP